MKNWQISLVVCICQLLDSHFSSAQKYDGEKVRKTESRSSLCEPKINSFNEIGCSFDVDPVDLNCPLFVKENSGPDGYHEVIVPVRNRIQVSVGGGFYAGCSDPEPEDPNPVRIRRAVTAEPKRRNRLKSPWPPKLKIKCEAHGKFTTIIDDGKEKDITEEQLKKLRCTSENKAEFQVKKDGYAGGTKFQMFFTLTDSNIKVKYMDGVLDDRFNSLMTHIIQVPSITEALSSSRRPAFARPPDSFGYPDAINVRDCYGTKISMTESTSSDQKASKTTGNAEVQPTAGRTTMAPLQTKIFEEYCRKKIISKTRAGLLARGHLTANRDFTYLFQRYETFYYTNAAPQWQLTNGGNFKHVEKMVRTIVAAQQTPCHVYSGTHGTMLYRQHGPSLCSVEVGSLKIPEVFWKVIYNPTSDTSLAFMVFNSPCPYETVLYLNLYTNMTGCSNSVCDDVWSRLTLPNESFPESIRDDPADTENYSGKTVCCKSAGAAFNVFRDYSCNFNELELLPLEVQLNYEQMSVVG